LKFGSALGEGGGEGKKGWVGGGGEKKKKKTKKTQETKEIHARNGSPPCKDRISDSGREQV
jgi:hypothetical protein